jgi:NADH-quinone oxidoreductase subunit E
MLSDQEKAEIVTALAHYEQKRGGCIEALRTVQRHRGWISDQSLAELADFLEMTIEELDSVATFYDLIFRKPVGRHVILFCNSVSCWIMGFAQLLDHMEKKLGIKAGQTTADGRFTLLPNGCLGACDHAPTLMVDGNLHEDLDREKIDEILARYE